MDLAAKRYGLRPSSLLRLHPEDPVALDFDIALALRAALEEAEAMEATRQSADEAGARHINAEDMRAGAPLTF